MAKISELHHEINEKPEHDDCVHSEIGNMDSEQYYDKCLWVQKRLESLNGLKVGIEGELRGRGGGGGIEELETRLWDVKTEISEVWHEVHQKPQHDGGGQGDGGEVEVDGGGEGGVEEMLQGDVENKIKVLLERKQDIEQKIVLNKTGAGLESIEDE